MSRSERNRSVAVLGLGKFGSSLAETVYSLGMDLMVVDRDPEKIREFASKSTIAVCADLENEDEIQELDLKHMDMVAVCMGTSLAPSVMCVMEAKEQGVPFVMAKALSRQMGTILKKVGADQVINPEAESAVRMARALASPTILDLFDVGENLCMIEMVPDKNWIGKTLVELDLRQKRGINVVAMKEQGSTWSYLDARSPIRDKSTLLVVLEKKLLDKL
ncbi:MAG: TrkA family potassium uptake protein [Oscillospiraceae bacterium]|nr:TrkA family potassium uptake protein [Oscillospiraceae bacterium]